MPKINRSVAALIVLSALQFQRGNRATAKKLMEQASEDEDFDDTVEGLGEAIADEEPVMEADDELDLDDADGEEVDEEVASLIRNKSRTRVKANGTADIDDGDSPGDSDNDNSEEIRQVNEEARLKRVQANLARLAKTGK